jgi:hypothetical protein
MGLRYTKRQYTRSSSKATNANLSDGPEGTLEREREREWEMRAKSGYNHYPHFLKPLTVQAVSGFFEPLLKMVSSYKSSTFSNFGPNLYERFLCFASIILWTSH